MRKQLIAGAIGAAAVAAVSLASSASANVYGGYYATTEVQWGGSNCIAVNEAYGYSDYLCGYGQSWHRDEIVYSGQDFGLDPVMGGADWISCQVYVDTRLVWSDYGSRGDGTDVNCLRNKY
jgi:hypothetical protein